jgi:predicted transcriptional regulator
MRTDYENAVKEFLPALRARSAKIMATRYGINQLEIARLLKVTQAAVSKYLSGRYSLAVKKMESTLSDSDVDAFVKNVLEEKPYEAQIEVCRMCARELTHKCSIMIK